MGRLYSKKLSSQSFDKLRMTVDVDDIIST
jgi:hypothetical protein